MVVLMEEENSRNVVEGEEENNRILWPENQYKYSLHSAPELT